MIFVDKRLYLGKKICRSIGPSQGTVKLRGGSLTALETTDSGAAVSRACGIHDTVKCPRQKAMLNTDLRRMIS